MEIDAKTIRNAVVGKPISHSFSPKLHRAIYQALSINAVLLAFEKENVKAIVDSIRSNHTPLTAVTLPYKEAIFSELDEITETAKNVQAVNTILYRDQKLIGDNTDLAGIAYALRDIPLHNRNVLILGAGGAARAAAFYAKQQNAQVLIYNRSESSLNTLCEDFDATPIRTLSHLQHEVTLIINATPVGMFPHVEQNSLSHYPFNASQVVFDMVYHPQETLLLKKAKASGAHTISGIEMFVMQGIRQVELWRNEIFDKAWLLPKLLQVFP